ncbi:MAG TPA: hypothetical protein VKA53_01555, partial [Thermoanaerobaculia bacterium]|nr:hypothetical protein [Thermoanaerobaculia bacterium]
SPFRQVLREMPSREEDKFLPAFFERRGPPLIAVVARWQRVEVADGEMLPGAGGHSWQWIAPPRFDGTLASFVIQLRSPDRVENLDSIRLLLGPTAVARAIGRRGKHGLSIVTGRVRIAGGDALELVVPTIGTRETRISVRAYRWRPSPARTGS